MIGLSEESKEDGDADDQSEREDGHNNAQQRLYCRFINVRCNNRTSTDAKEYGDTLSEIIQK